MYLKHVTTISVFLAPIILAGVAPFNLDTRSGCNADNCLRALQRKGSAANSFCASYTAATTTEVTSLPSYVPKICGPSRVSSACSCIASQTSASQTSASLTSTSQTSTSQTSTSQTSTSQTSTSQTSTSQTSTSQTSAPSACSTGQVVVNPSFFGYPNPEGDLKPWVIGHESGAAGCKYNPSSYAEAASDQYYGDPRSIKCAFPASGGQDYISQELTNLCPKVQYTLTYKVACDYLEYGAGQAQAATSITAIFNYQTVTPKQLCPSCDGGDPNASNCSYPYYQLFSTTVFGPDSGNATLKFEVSQGAVGKPSYPLLLDIIYLEGQGYDGPPYNPPIPI